MRHSRSYPDIAARAQALGASLVGVVPLKVLLAATSHRGRHPAGCAGEDAAVIVLALVHPPGRQRMDWWDSRPGGTPGNRRLIRINREMVRWLKKRLKVDAADLPYDPADGGVLLKDAAVLAGLGVIGRNNLLVTPRFGPRIRLRGLLVGLPLRGTGPLPSNAPCEICDGPCLRACPRRAFKTGSYQRERCRMQMTEDASRRIVLAPPGAGLPAQSRIAYCRACELACPVGR